MLEEIRKDGDAHLRNLVQQQDEAIRQAAAATRASHDEDEAIRQAAAATLAERRAPNREGTLSDEEKQDIHGLVRDGGGTRIGANSTTIFMENWVVKVIPDYNLALEEYNLLSKFHHRNIVPVVHFSTAPMIGTWMVMPNAGCEPDKYVEQNIQTADDGRRFFQQCSEQMKEGLNYLHGKGWIHMDIKGPNVMCKRLGDKDDKSVLVTLIDLGLAAPIAKLQNSEGPEYDFLSSHNPPETPIAGVCLCHAMWKHLIANPKLLDVFGYGMTLADLLLYMLKSNIFVVEDADLAKRISQTRPPQRAYRRGCMKTIGPALKLLLDAVMHMFQRRFPLDISVWRMLSACHYDSRERAWAEPEDEEGRNAWASKLPRMLDTWVEISAACQCPSCLPREKKG